MKSFSITDIHSYLRRRNYINCLKSFIDQKNLPASKVDVLKHSQITKHLYQKICTNNWNIVLNQNYQNYPQYKQRQSNVKNNLQQKENKNVEVQGVSFYQYQANQPIEDYNSIFFVQKIKQAIVISVFDGHGGPQMAQYCAKRFQSVFNFQAQLRIEKPEYINNQRQLLKDCLYHSYERLQNEFYTQIYQKNQSLKSIGTCALSVIIWNNFIITCSSGDSLCISTTLQTPYKFSCLSQKFNCSSQSQRLRLIKQHPNDSQILISQTKNHYYIKGLLQPTRTLGDYYLKRKQDYRLKGDFNGPYVGWQPEIKQFQIKAQYQQVIIATDGLWDFLANWDVLKHVVQYHNSHTQTNQNKDQEKDTQDDYQASLDQPTNINIAQYLTDRVLQKVANDIQMSVQYIKQLQPGQIRRRYHDDISIFVIDIKKLSQTLSTR